MHLVKRVVILLRLPYHLNFIAVIAGALRHSDVWFPLLPRILALYFSFNVLFYSGIYCFNAWTDFYSDVMNKPWRSQYWSRASYLIWAILFISTGLGSVGLLPAALPTRLALVSLYFMFIAVNAMYSIFIRQCSGLAQAAFVALTCPLRVLLGLIYSLDNVSAAVAIASEYALDLFGAYCCMFTFQYIRKLPIKGPGPDPLIVALTLVLPFIFMAIRGTVDVAWVLYLGATCVFIFPSLYSRPRSLMGRLWW